MPYSHLPFRFFGSNASRRPSPTKLNPRTVSRIKNPAGIHTNQKLVNTYTSFTAFTILPQEAIWEFNTDSKEAKSCLHQNNITKSHCCNNDQLWDNVGESGDGKYVWNTNTCRFCCNHELLLTKGEDLSTYHTGNAWPSHDTENQDRTKCINTDSRIDLVIIHNRTDDNVQRHCWEYRLQHQPHGHENGIYPSSKITGQTTDQNTNKPSIMITTKPIIREIRPPYISLVSMSIPFPSVPTKCFLLGAA